MKLWPFGVVGFASDAGIEPAFPGDTRRKCEGKFRFDDPSSAAKAAKRQSAHGYGKMHGYLCSECGGHHVGHGLSRKGTKLKWVKGRKR